METINDRIGIVLEMTGMTKTAFGKSLKVSQQYISKLIKTGNPSDLLIEDICEKYNISESWLRTGVGSPQKEQTRSESIAKFAEELMKDEEESFRRQLVEVLSQLDESEWKVLEKMAKKLAGISEPPQPRFHSEAPSEEELLRSGMVLGEEEDAG